MRSSTDTVVMEGSTIEGMFKEPYPNLINVATWYWHVHPYASLVVCFFGITTNFFNIVILTRKDLSPINCILSVIAASDLCLMACYLPFAIHFYIMTDLTPTSNGYTLGWSQFLMFHINFTAVLHTASIWLAVYLAAFRYFFLNAPSTRTTCFQLKSTFAVIPTIFSLSAILTLPNFLITQNEEKIMPSNETLYRLKDLGIGTPNPNPIALVMFWIYGIFGKIIPSILIAIFGGMLLKTLLSAKHRSDSLKSSHGSHRSRPYSRTTVMLLIIIVLYLITELPHGIMVLMCCCAEGFFQNVYMPLGDIMDIFALINNAVNFILYCWMSQRFRKAFLEIMPKYGPDKNGHTKRLDVITQRGTPV